jgi:transcriptional regulator with XRE-family HTH domain
MSEEIIQIAARIRELREIFDYTEEQMAAEVGVSPAEYREYEARGENIPISVLYHIAQKFGVDMNEILTGKASRLRTYEITRRGTGKTIKRYEGYHFESLSPLFAGKVMEPLLVTLLPGEEKPALVAHPGQEFNLVLEGTVVVTYDGKELVLAAGDAIYFDPTHPHGQHATGEGKARFLTMIIE